MLNPISLVLIGLRGAALGLELQGQKRSADSLYALADAAEAGKAIDEHMALVAAKLKDRNANDDDWKDVTERIEADSERLQRPADGPGSLTGI